MMNLLVVSGSEQEALQYILIARELASQGIATHIIATRKHVYEFIRNQGWEHTKLMAIRRCDTSKSIDSHRYLEKYRNPTIAEMMASEQVIRHWDADEKLLLLADFLDIYEDYFEKHHIDILMKFPTCSFAGRAAYAVAKRRNLPTLIINTGPIITETFTLNDLDEGWIWSEFFTTYETPKSLTPENKKIVNEIVERVLSDKEKSIKIIKARLRRVLFALFVYLYHRCKGEFDYAERNEVVKQISFFLGRIKRAVKYSQQDTSKPYIFFPLHIPWDAQIATRNPMFASQEAVIEMLARSCPPGMALYVKEHPYYAGGVNRKMLKNVKRFQMVRVVEPSISSLEMIRHAKVVVTINSTAGWEAIVLKKPLIVLGDPFYAQFKHAYKIENINTLPRVLNEAICKGESIYNDVDAWYDFLYSAVSSSHKGSMVFYKNYMGLGQDFSHQRIESLAREIGAKIKALCVDPSERNTSEKEIAQESF